jgi:hypothetical protein
MENLHQPAPAQILYVCAACGAFILWGKLSLTQEQSVAFLTRFLELYISRAGIRKGIEPLLFVALGTFLAVMIIAPVTPAQAFAAGLGWTGLTTAPNEQRRRRT